MTEHRIELSQLLKTVVKLTSLLFSSWLLYFHLFNRLLPACSLLCCSFCFPLERYLCISRKAYIWDHTITLFCRNIYQYKVHFISMLCSCTKKKGWPIRTLLPLCFFSFLVFNLLPLSLLSNTNQNTQKPLHLEVLFCIAQVRLNCLIVVQTSCCPSLVQDEWRGRTYPMGLCEENRLLCQLQPVLFLLLHSFSACTDHTNSGWSSTFFQVFLSSWNFLNLTLVVASKCKTDKSDCVAVRMIWE